MSDFERSRHLLALADRCLLRVKAAWGEMHGVRREIAKAGGYCSTMLGKTSGSPLVYEVRGYEHWCVMAGEPGDPEVRPDLAETMRELNLRLSLRSVRERRLREAAWEAMTKGTP